MSGTWVKVDAERVLYVHRGREVILCTEQTFPNGAEFVLRLSESSKEALRRELRQIDSQSDSNCRSD